MPTALLSVGMLLAISVYTNCFSINIRDIPSERNVKIIVHVQEDPKISKETPAIEVKTEDKLETENKVPPDADEWISNLINKFVKPSGDFVPDFKDRAAIGTGLNDNCPEGQSRVGPICVKRKQ